MVSWAQWVGKAGSCVLILQEHFSLRACMSTGRVSDFSLIAKWKDQILCINRRAGIKGSRCLRVLIYIPRAGDCAALSFLFLFRSRRLTKCAQKEICSAAGYSSNLCFIPSIFCTSLWQKSCKENTRDQILSLVQTFLITISLLGLRSLSQVQRRRCSSHISPTIYPPPESWSITSMGKLIMKIDFDGFEVMINAARGNLNCLWVWKVCNKTVNMLTNF